VDTTQEWKRFESERLFLLEMTFDQLGDYIYVIKEDGTFALVLKAIVRV